MKGNLIITREFLRVPGSTEWTLPSVAGWNVANTNTMEALKKTEGLSTHSPCLFSPEMKGGLQVSRNCAFWLVFIDSEVFADRQTDRQAGREGFHYSDVVSFPPLPRGSHCWHSLHIAVASPAGAGANGSCLSPRWCWKPGCPQGTRLLGSQWHPQHIHQRCGNNTELGVQPSLRNLGEGWRSESDAEGDPCMAIGGQSTGSVWKGNISLSCVQPHFHLPFPDAVTAN